MVKLRSFLNVRYTFILLAVISAVETASAQWRVVIDPYCIGQVTANTASQKAIEDQHNNRLDSISAKQNKLERYTVSMATIKELYKVTLENITGFGPESKYYIEIGRCAIDIVKDVPELVSVVNKAKFHNKVLCLKELADVVTETQQLVADFVNIVNNAKIQNPLKGKASAEARSDGYNFLDRYERLTVAHKIYADLMAIRYKIQGMMTMAQYATMNDLFIAIAPEGWANMMIMQNTARGLVAQWHGIVNESRNDMKTAAAPDRGDHIKMFNLSK